MATGVIAPPLVFYDGSSMEKAKLEGSKILIDICGPGLSATHSGGQIILLFVCLFVCLLGVDIGTYSIKGTQSRAQALEIATHE